MNTDNYQCSLCEKIFCSKQSMNYHLSHTVCKMKNVCPTCDKSFSTKQKLNQHISRNICVSKTKLPLKLKMTMNLEEMDLNYSEDFDESVVKNEIEKKEDVQKNVDNNDNGYFGEFKNEN